MAVTSIVQKGRRTLIALCCTTSLAASGANLVPDTAVVTVLVRITQDEFWGSAVDRDGRPIMPGEGVDPGAPVIDESTATRVVDAAYVVGRAMWCEVPWQPYYLDLMGRERSTGTASPTQLAFIGMLFGVAQAIVANLYKESFGACSDTDRVAACQEMRSASKLCDERLAIPHPGD